jgi:tRNA/rRNA methyltransferase
MQTDASGVNQLAAPIVILVRPQMGENIGAAARAMMNCGLFDLRLVSPRDGWPNPAALPMAAGGAAIIEHAVVFETVADAAHDVTMLFALSARRRDLRIMSSDPRAAAAMMVAHAGLGDLPSERRCAIMFGPEASGLDNDEVVLADRLVTAALNPDYPSLNLAQAVLLMAWEWREAVRLNDPPPQIDAGHVPAPIRDRDVFLSRLESALDTGGFFTAPEMAKTVRRNLRALFTRAAPTGQEISTLHGVVQALMRGRQPGAQADGQND